MGRWNGVLWVEGTGVGVEERVTVCARESGILGAEFGPVTAERDITSSFVPSITVVSSRAEVTKGDAVERRSSGGEGSGTTCVGSMRRNGGTSSSDASFSFLPSSSVSFSSSVCSSTVVSAVCRVIDFHAECIAVHSKRIMRTKYIRLRMLSGPALGRMVGSVEERDGRLDDVLDGRRDDVEEDATEDDDGPC